MPDVHLHHVTYGDGPELIAANAMNAAYHRPWNTPFTDQEGFEQWFAHTQTENHTSLIARHAANNGIVEVINFSQIVRGIFLSAYIGYYGMEAYSGRGLMTDALRQSLTYAFETLGLHRVEANIQPGNIKSVALVKRVGFRKEGFSPNYLFIDNAWRDHERWAVTREDVHPADGRS